MERNECLERFLAAVRDARRGDYSRAKALVESVRREQGDRAANTAREELWAYTQSDKKA